MGASVTRTLPGQHRSSMSTHRAYKDETLLLSKHASDSPQTSPTVQEGQGTPQQESKTGAKHMGGKKSTSCALLSLLLGYHHENLLVPVTQFFIQLVLL